MRQLILLFLFILNSYLVAGGNKLVIAFNLNDCVNCSQSIQNLKLINENIKIEFILERMYENETDQIKDILNLQAVNFDIIYSDELYKRYIKNKYASTVNFFNDSESVSVQYLLKEDFSSSLAHYFNSLTFKNYTYSFNTDFIKLGTESLFFRNNYIYAFNKYNNEIDIVNLITPAKNKNIKINDSVAFTAYYKFLGDSSLVEYNFDVLKSLNFGNNKLIQKIYADENNDIFVSVKYIYFEIENNFKDTFQNQFNALHQFSPSGKLKSSGLIHPITYNNEQVKFSSFYNEKNDAILYYPRISDFSLKGDTMLISIVNPELSKDHFENNNFLAYYIKNKLGDYEFFRFFPEELPDVYKDFGWFFTHPVFSANSKFLALTLSDNIYSIKDEKLKFNLRQFQEKQFQGDVYNTSYNVFHIESAGDNIHFVYYNNLTSEKHYVIYDFRTDEIIKSTKIELPVDKFFNRYYFLDPFDPNYLFVPNSKSSILRLKIE